jgi:hypothetical protein
MEDFSPSREGLAEIAVAHGRERSLLRTPIVIIAAFGRFSDFSGSVGLLPLSRRLCHNVIQEIGSGR